MKRRKYTVVGRAGEVHALRQAAIRSFVVDYSQVSGGTGFAILEVSDPETVKCGDGIELRVKADFSSRSDRARLQVQGAEASIAPPRPVTVRSPASGPLVYGTPSPQDEKLPAGSSGVMAQHVNQMRLLLPSQSVQYWDLERSLPWGRDVILHASMGAGNEGHLLVGRVKSVK